MADQQVSKKVTAEAAGYMELPGAVKDAGCQIVNVPGGVARRKGCCNLYKPTPESDEFRCGECRFVQLGGFASKIGRK